MDKRAVKNTIRKIQIYLKVMIRYRWSFQQIKRKRLIMLIDGTDSHGGLVDRFKGLITGMALADTYGFEFVFVYHSPFLLSHYITCAPGSGYIQQEALTLHPLRTRLIRWKDKLPSREEVKNTLSNAAHDVLLYCNLDFISRFQDFHTKPWEGWFNENFAPAPHLVEKLQSYSNAGTFTAIHARFTSLLGDFSDTSHKELSPEKRLALLEQCVKAVKQIYNTYGPRVFLFSDSTLFLNRVKETLPQIQQSIGEPKHVDSMYDDTDFEKEFIDFFLLSAAGTVVSLRGNGLYPSDFPVYAARLNAGAVIPFTI